jgi:hypothetical protein
MWPKDKMPDPTGAKRLLDMGCKVTYQKEELMVPRKVYKPEDFRPGTKKGKIDAHPIWTVTIIMPKKLMQDVYVGKENKENNRMAELMKYSTNSAETENIAQEETQEAPADATT